MKTIYTKKDQVWEEKETLEKNFWLSIINPTKEELAEMGLEFQIDENDQKRLLDKSELSYFEVSEEKEFAIIRIPYIENKKYKTEPLNLFFFKNGLITISIHEPIFLEDMKKINIHKDANHILISLIGKSTEYYLKLLNEIQEDIFYKEHIFLTKASNKDLSTMLAIQKSLLYFTTALQGNKTILEKCENLTLSNSDQELLKDNLIEIKQALEMAKTAQEILENTMNTYTSIISNNLNDIMKFLTSITLVISIPTMISSFLGMNVYLGEFGKNPFSFLLILLVSLLISILLIIILKKKNLL